MAQTTASSAKRTSSIDSRYLVVRICLALSITLGPLTFLLYALLNPGGKGAQAIIAANMTENALLNQLHLLFGVLASFLLPLGFLGLALLALRRAPRLGSLAFLLALPGWTPLSALIALDALSYDMAHVGGGQQFAALWEHFNSDGVMFSYTLIYAICHLLCAIFVGIALGRTRLVPLWAASALVISSPLILVGFPTHLDALLFIALGLLTLGSIPASFAILKTRE